MRATLIGLLCSLTFVFVGCSVGFNTHSPGISAGNAVGISAFPPSLLSSKDTTDMTALSDSVNPYQGLWWNPSESGWGMTLTQHNSTIFVAMYTYDSAGNSDWYVIPNCAVVNNGCNGDIFHVVGGSPLTSSWQGQNRAVTSVGNGILNFSDGNHGVFHFTINGVAGSKTIEKDIFTLTSNPEIDYSDMWWNANESGWGATVTHEGNNMFIAVYTYDQAGNPTWYVASNCAVTNNTCTGPLYHTAGGRPLTSSWNASNVAVTPVGSITFNFSDSAHATMSYTIDGRSGSKSITRIPFGDAALPEAPVPGINYPVTIVTQGSLMGTFNSYNDFAAQVIRTGGSGGCITVDDVMAFGQDNFPPCLHLATANPVVPPPPPPPPPATCSGSKPADDTRNLSCAPGHVGAIMQSRSYTCIGTTWTPGDWIQTADTCVTSGGPVTCTPGVQANGSFTTNGIKNLTIAQNGFASYALPLYPMANRILEILSIESTSSQADIPDEFSISTCPGDFDVGPGCKTYGIVDQSGTQLYAETSLAPINGLCTLILGQQYYINVRMVRPDGTPGCSASSCQMILQLNSYMQ